MFNVSICIRIKILRALQKYIDTTLYGQVYQNNTHSLYFISKVYERLTYTRIPILKYLRSSRYFLVGDRCYADKHLNTPQQKNDDLKKKKISSLCARPLCPPVGFLHRQKI